MQISLTLEKVRPYDLVQWQSADGDMHVIYGANGIGKTTLLESLYACLCGRSFKTHQLKQMIRKEGLLQEQQSLYAKANLNLKALLLEQSRQMQLSSRSSQFFINDSKVKKRSELYVGLIPLALVPEDIALINGSAEHRRNFLDHILFFLKPDYMKLLQDYKKALKNKQSLLKSKLNYAAYVDAVEVWNDMLLRLGNSIRKLRSSLCQDMQQDVQNFFAMISSGDILQCDAASLKLNNSDISKQALNMNYVFHEADKGMVLEQVVKDKLEAEYFTQRSQWGCHKDDLVLSMSNGQSFSSQASQGEKASCLLAMKLAEFKQLQSLDEQVCLLLDDIGGTLDEQRRSTLLQWIKHNKIPSILSTADPNIKKICQNLGAHVYEYKAVENELDSHMGKWDITQSLGLIDT